MFSVNTKNIFVEFCGLLLFLLFFVKTGLEMNNEKFRIMERIMDRTMKNSIRYNDVTKIVNQK